MKCATSIFCCLVLFVVIAEITAEECTAGDTKQQDCNSCKCIKGEGWACTRKQCLPRSKRAAEECKQGDTKMDDCNPCKCIAGGKWACSRAICPSTPRQKRQAPTYCTPKETFKKDCNTCVCNDDGTNAACTLKGCVNI